MTSPLLIIISLYLNNYIIGSINAVKLLLHKNIDDFPKKGKVNATHFTNNTNSFRKYVISCYCKRTSLVTVNVHLLLQLKRNIAFENNKHARN